MQLNYHPFHKWAHFFYINIFLFFFGVGFFFSLFSFSCSSGGSQYLYSVGVFIVKEIFSFPLILPIMNTAQYSTLIYFSNIFYLLLSLSMVFNAFFLDLLPMTHEYIAHYFHSHKIDYYSINFFFYILIVCSMNVIQRLLIQFKMIHSKSKIQFRLPLIHLSNRLHCKSCQKMFSCSPFNSVASYRRNNDLVCSCK